MRIDPKVVDENGEPMVVYHGTRGRFWEFDERKIGKRHGALNGRGFYFTSSPYAAREYASNGMSGGRTIPAFLNIRHPDRHDIDALGADGVIGAEMYHDLFVVKHPNQIKSATDNAGTFSEANPDIRFSRGDIAGQGDLFAATDEDARNGGFALDGGTVVAPKRETKEQPKRDRRTNAQLAYDREREREAAEAEMDAIANSLGLADAPEAEVAQKRQMLDMLKGSLTELRGLKTALKNEIAARADRGKATEGENAPFMRRCIAQTEEIVNLLKGQFGLSDVDNDAAKWDGRDSTRIIDKRIRAIEGALERREAKIAESRENTAAIQQNIDGAVEAMPDIDTGRTGFRETALKFLDELVGLGQSYRDWVPPAQTGGETMAERKRKAHTPANHRKWLASPFVKDAVIPEEETTRMPMQGVGARSEYAEDEAREAAAEAGTADADMAHRQLLADGVNYQERRAGGRSGVVRKTAESGDTRTVREVLAGLKGEADKRWIVAHTLLRILENRKEANASLPRALVLDALDFHRRGVGAGQPRTGVTSRTTYREGREKFEAARKAGVADAIAKVQGAMWFLEDGFLPKAKDGMTAYATLADGRRFAVPVKNADILTDAEVEALRELAYALNETTDRSLAALAAMERGDGQRSATGLAPDQPMFSRGGIYTGSAADYAERVPVLDKDGNVTGYRIDNGPSLKYVGTGEGTQVFGWGLYGSTVRGVAESYAITGDDSYAIYMDGRQLHSPEVGDNLGSWQLMRFRSAEDPVRAAREDAIKSIENGNEDDRDFYGRALAEIDAHKWDLKKEHSTIYEQTFFTDRAPGDESHLLKWYEPVDKELIKHIVDAIRKDSLLRSVVRGDIGRLLSNATGKDVYECIVELMQASDMTNSGQAEAPRRASTWLAANGVDGVKYPVNSYGGKGVKDGDVAGWNYVSFRDDNIRVDHKWVDGDIRFSRGDIFDRGDITPEQDAAYMDAVRRGDMVTAARMVREAAAKAMPDTKVVDEDGLPKVVWHNSDVPLGTPYRNAIQSFVNERALKQKALSLVDSFISQHFGDRDKLLSAIKRELDTNYGRGSLFASNGENAIINNYEKHGLSPDKLLSELERNEPSPIFSGQIVIRDKNGEKIETTWPAGVRNIVDTWRLENDFKALKKSLSDIGVSDPFADAGSREARRLFSLALERNESWARQLADKYGLTKDSWGRMTGLDNIIANITQDDVDNASIPLAYNKDRVSSDSGYYGPGIYFSDHETNSYGPHHYAHFINISNPIVLTKTATPTSGQNYNLNTKLASYTDSNGQVYNWYELADAMSADGHDGIIVLASSKNNILDETGDEFVIPNNAPYQIKSADPVTYDDAGNVIPLSQRFNLQKDDIRFSRGDVSDDVRKAFANDPETRNWTIATNPSVIANLPPQSLEVLPPVTERTDNNSVEKAMKQLFADFGEVRNAASGERVVFNRADAGKMMMQSGADMRTLSPHLKALFENAIPAWSETPLDMPGHTKHPEVVGYRNYVNKFADDGGEKFVRFTVREDNVGRNGVHAATVSNIEVYERKEAGGNDPANKSGATSRIFIDKRLSKFLGKVKEKSVGGDVRFSRSDIFYRGADSRVQAIIDARNASARGPAKAPGVMDRPESRLDRFLRTKQDSNLPTKRLMDDFNVSAKDNVYLAEDRRYGKDEHQTRELLRGTVNPILDECAKRNVAVADLDAYLAAWFAGERNKMIADRTANVVDDGSGLSDTEAAAILQRYRDNGMEADLEAIAQKVWKMNRDTLERLVDAGLLARAQADKWMELSPHYVPLRTMLENEDFDDSAVSAAITRLESKHALGRSSVASSPLIFSIIQAEQAIVRANKNEVRQLMAKFVRDHAADGIGKILDGQPLRKAYVDGKVRWVVDSGFREKRNLKDALGEDNVIQFKEDGKLKYIVLNGERGKLVARAITKYGMSGLDGKIGETVMGINRFLANTRTSWSLPFMLRNLGYDTQQVVWTMNMDGLHKASALYAKNVLSGSAIRAAREYLAKGTYTGELGRYMKEFVENGGLIKGGTSQGWDETTDLIAKELGASTTKLGRMMDKTAATKAVKNGWRVFMDKIERANSTIEMQTRLAVYAALAAPVEEGGAGWSKEEAVAYARDVTVNFNRKGEQGQIINNWWMFANASIQDMERIARSLLGNEARKHGGSGKLGSRAATLGALLALGIIQALGGGDDDDDEMENMTDYSKQTSWYRRLGRTPYYFRIGRRGPYNLVPYIGQRLTEVHLGKASAADAAADIGEMLYSLALDPTNSGQLMRSGNGRSIDMVDTAANVIFPTALAPLAQMATDRTFTGEPLTRKRFNENLPASHNGKERTTTAAKWTAEKINALTGGDEFTAGKIDIPPEYLELFVSSLFGSLGSDTARVVGVAQDAAKGEFNPERVPFLRDIVRKIPDNTQRFYEAQSRQKGYETSAKGYRDGRDWAKVREFEADHPSARQGTAKRLRDMAKRIRELRDLETRQTGEVAERTRQRRTKLQGEYIKLLGD